MCVQYIQSVSKEVLRGTSHASTVIEWKKCLLRRRRLFEVDMGYLLEVSEKVPHMHFLNGVSFCRIEGSLGLGYG